MLVHLPEDSSSTSSYKYSYEVASANITAGSIEKKGSSIKFTVGKKSNTVNNSAVETTIVNEVAFHIVQSASKTAMANNYIASCKLQRTDFTNNENIPNIFSPGDVLTVDTSDAGVYLDDGSATISASYLGALGNDWEDFALVPGTNTIAVDYSDFTTTPPDFKLTYRNRYL